ncbi:hypothetical protein EJB05_35817, partial [Eragrostis curvula]
MKNATIQELGKTKIAVAIKPNQQTKTNKKCLSSPSSLLHWCFSGVHSGPFEDPSVEQPVQKDEHPLIGKVPEVSFAAKLDGTQPGLQLEAHGQWQANPPSSYKR